MMIVNHSPLDAGRALDGEDASEGSTGQGLWIAVGLEAALRARAPQLHASTPAVRALAREVCVILGCGPLELGLVDVSIRLRDVGMVALPDAVVLQTSTMAPPDWEVLATHPVVGETMIGAFGELAPAATLVRSHHERWDGEGYPDGLRGEAIPRLSRVIAACDAFVAIAHDRPHRHGLGREVALERVCSERERQFDPQVTDALLEAIAGSGRGSPPGAGATPRPGIPAGATRGRAPSAGARARSAGARARSAGDPALRGGSSGLGAVIRKLAALPAFAPAREQVLALLAEDGAHGGDLVRAIEGDLGLTIAVLREARGSQAGPVANVPDALNAVDRARLRAVVDELPPAAFPWRTRWERSLQQARVHAQAVARAAQRIAHELERVDRDLVLTVALLHDVGKVVLALAHGEYDSDGVANVRTPEERLRSERQEFTVDHASVGGLVLERWGLHRSLVAGVRGHHAAEDGEDPAGIVRLADSIVHYVQGEPVSGKVIVTLAARAGLDLAALRRVLFELPHGGGSQRRRARPSTLTAKESAVLRRLAEGKVYKQIAAEIHVSTSTVRTHLHNIYTKLGVDDRAQAVLRATELGWI